MAFAHGYTNLFISCDKAKNVPWLIKSHPPTRHVLTTLCRVRFIEQYPPERPKHALWRHKLWRKPKKEQSLDATQRLKSSRNAHISMHVYALVILRGFLWACGALVSFLLSREKISRYPGRKTEPHHAHNKGKMRLKHGVWSSIERAAHVSNCSGHFF
jgi:hypothetical protein